MVDFGESLFQKRDAVLDDSLVHFQLRFTRSAQSHAALAAATAGAAALAFQVSPQALQAGEQVSVLRQFHLRLGTGCLGAHGKDIENQTGAVEYFHLQFFLNIAQLFCREFIVEYDHAHFALGIGLVIQIAFNLLKFAAANVGRTTGSVTALCEAVDGMSPRGFGKKLQFVKIFLCAAFILLRCDESHEHSSFSLGFRAYEFFHTPVPLSLW